MNDAHCEPAYERRASIKPSHGEVLEQVAELHGAVEALNRCVCVLQERLLPITSTGDVHEGAAPSPRLHRVMDSPLGSQLESIASAIQEQNRRLQAQIDALRL